jgi:hypothetical protein
VRRLTSDEREIRKSRGISIVRFLPFALPIIAVIIMSSSQQLFIECIGKPIEDGGRLGALIKLIAGLACSEYYVRDFSHHRWVIAMFCVGIGLSIPQIFWMQRHKAYWDAVRAKEKLKRSEKAAARQKATQEKDPASGP